MSSEDSAEKDYPLLLMSTSEWKEKGALLHFLTNFAYVCCFLLSYLSTDTKVWDVIADLVAICTSPSPPNPFAVDFDFFEALPSTERVLATAAMISLLRSILTSGSHRYDRRGNERKS